MKLIQLCNTSLWLRCSKITYCLSFQTGIISISVYYINDNNFICTFMILILRMHNILSISKECIKDMIKLTRGPKGHISCTWVQCATSLTEQPRPPFLYDPKTQIWYIKTLRSCFLSSFVEFCSAVSEKSKMFQPIRGQGGHLVFPIGLKNTNLEGDVVILFPVMFRWIPFSSCSGEVENVSANQRPGRPSCFSHRPEKHKLGREQCNLVSCQVSLNSVQRFQRRSRKCLSQSEARAAILFFWLARKTQTW